MDSRVGDDFRSVSSALILRSTCTSRRLQHPVISLIYRYISLQYPTLHPPCVIWFGRRLRSYFFLKGQMLTCSQIVARDYEDLKTPKQHKQDARTPGVARIIDLEPRVSPPTLDRDTTQKKQYSHESRAIQCPTKYRKLQAISNGDRSIEINI